MAYDIANALRIRTPDFIGVDQLKRRNALAERDQTVQEQNAASYRNQLNMAAQARQQSASDAKRAEGEAWLANGINTVRQNPALIPNLIREGKARGILKPDIPDNATPDQVEAFALEHGIAAKAQTTPYGVQMQQGPFGSRIVTDGSRFQVIEPPRAAAASRPNWTKVDLVKDDKPTVGLVDMNAANPEATFRPLGDAPRPASSANPQSLRKEFDGQDSVKNYRSALTQYKRAQTAPDTRAGDISVVYALGKIFDPNSVVRGGELTLSQNAQPWLQKIVGEANSQVSRTGRLDAATRVEIVGAMKGQIDSTGEAYASDRDRFSQYAQDAGFDPYSVVGANLYEPEANPAQAVPSAPVRGQTYTHPSGARVTIEN